MISYNDFRNAVRDGTHIEQRQFARQWWRNALLMGLIAVLCLAAMGMAWRAGRPINDSYTEAQLASRVSNQTGKVALLTAELQFWQLRVVQSFAAQGAAALGADAQARAKHNALLKELNAAVDLLVAEDLSPTQRSAAAELTQAMEAFDRSDREMMVALVQSKAAPVNQTQLSHTLPLEQTQQSASELVKRAKKLSEMTSKQSQALQSVAYEENGALWTGIALTMGFALLLAALLAFLLRKALKSNAALLRQVNDAARTDPLTGLLNRRALEQRLEFEYKRASRDKSPLALVMIDIDFFKKYNDAHGHAQGDVLLRSCAESWRRDVRASDLVARMGGEEFAIVMNRCDAHQASAKTVALRQAMPWDTSFSAGVAMWQDGEAFVDWYKRADAALYVAKQNGRARTEIAANPTPAI
jgi:diguanylate cyclase (GGDEF)-like protein